MVAQHKPSFRSFRKPLRRYFDLDEIFKATPFLNRAMKTRGWLLMPRGALANKPRTTQRKYFKNQFHLHIYIN